MSHYDADILLWSKRQGELLRRHAAGELVNEAEVGWPNIAEEIESVGLEQLHAGRSLLRQAILHVRQDAVDRYTPAMRQRIDLARIYSRALQRLPKQIDNQLPLPVPDTCPWTLDEPLSAEP